MGWMHALRATRELWHDCVHHGALMRAEQVWAAMNRGMLGRVWIVSKVCTRFRRAMRGGLHEGQRCPSHPARILSRRWGGLCAAPIVGCREILLF